MSCSATALVIPEKISKRISSNTTVPSFWKKSPPRKGPVAATAPTKIPKADDAWPMSAGWWMRQSLKSEARNPKFETNANDQNANFEKLVHFRFFRRWSLLFYLTQLALNALWTWVFFAWRQGGWALVEIVVLGIMILITLSTFHRVRPLAGYLLVPYLVWVGFAGVLNAVLWRLNPELL
jgi:hypothetical protein